MTKPGHTLREGLAETSAGPPAHHGRWLCPAWPYRGRLALCLDRVFAASAVPRCRRGARLGGGTARRPAPPVLPGMTSARRGVGYGGADCGRCGSRAAPRGHRLPRLWLDPLPWRPPAPRQCAGLLAHLPRPPPADVTAQHHDPFLPRITADSAQSRRQAQLGRSSDPRWAWLRRSHCTRRGRPPCATRFRSSRTLSSIGG